MYKSLLDLGHVDVRNLFPLISCCSKPEAGHHPASGACSSRRPAIPSTTFWSSLFLATSLLLTWKVSPQAHGQAASRHSSGRPVSWHPASSPLDDWLLSTLADPPREACAACRGGLWNTFPGLGEMLFSTVLSEVKRCQMQWQQGPVLVYKKRHPKNPEEKSPTLNNSKKTSLWSHK